VRGPLTSREAKFENGCLDSSAVVDWAAVSASINADHPPIDLSLLRAERVPMPMTVPDPDYTVIPPAPLRVANSLNGRVVVTRHGSSVSLSSVYTLRWDLSPLTAFPRSKSKVNYLSYQHYFQEKYGQQVESDQPLLEAIHVPRSRLLGLLESRLLGLSGSRLDVYFHAVAGLMRLLHL
jgi:hypothetical protein